MSAPIARWRYTRDLPGGRVFGPLIGRVERDITGGVTLHLAKDGDVLELVDGEEFVTVYTGADPYQPPAVTQ